MKIYVAFVLLFFISKSIQQDNDDYCSFISGEGCKDGICKYCAMCLPNSCILATPYSTGDNDGSTCAATEQYDGYDFYNYCLSSDTDDDDCYSNTECYPYQQGDFLTQQPWKNLTCDPNTCTLVMRDGTPPPKPRQLNITTSLNITHPTSGYINRNNVKKFDFYNKNPGLIVLMTLSIITFIFAIMFIIRCLFFKSKHWFIVNKYVFCGFCSSPPRIDDDSTRPPSFRTMDEELPSYRQDSALPKYEQAIVSQIRDSMPSSCSNQTIWIPFHVHRQDQTLQVTSPLFSQDWAAPTITRHHSSIREILDD